MSRSLEDQIRSYTDALYATATPIEDLVDEATEAVRVVEGPVRVTIEGTRAGNWFRTGPAIAVVAAVVVLLVLLPIMLLGRDTEESRPVDSETSTTISTTALDSVFLGSWVGTDRDGSVNTLLVDANAVVYVETGLTACLTEFGEYVGGSAQGEPRIDGDRLTFTGELFCDLARGHTSHPFFDGYEWVFVYDPASDTVHSELDPEAVLSRVD